MNQQEQDPESLTPTRVNKNRSMPRQLFVSSRDSTAIAELEEELSPIGSAEKKRRFDKMLLPVWIILVVGACLTAGK